MSSKSSWHEIRKLVYERANGCCEYCQTCEVNTGQTMQIDHIDPNGGDELANLCLACWNYNNHKRQAIFVIDPETGEEAALFNPRIQNWTDHFEWLDNATRLRGLTPTGRATIMRLKMNRTLLIVARKRWADGGYHPPS
jgi:hypothetical protein